MAAQRAYAHQFEVAAQHVPQHGQLVEPDASQQTSPEVDAVVLLEFPASLEALIVVDVRLHILRVGVHCAELVYHNLLAPFADAAQVDDGRPCGGFVVDGLGHFADGDEEFTFAELLVDDLETGTVEASQYLHTAHGAFLAAGDGEVKPACQPHLRAHAVPNVVPCHHQVVDAPRVACNGQVALQRRRHRVGAQVGALGQPPVGGIQHLVEPLHGVQRPGEEGEARREVLEAVGKCFGRGGGEGDDGDAAVGLFLSLFQVLDSLLIAQMCRVGQEPAYVFVVDFMHIQLGSLVAAGLGVAAVKLVL